MLMGLVMPKKDWELCESKITKFKRAFKRCLMCGELMGHQDDKRGTVYAICPECGLHIELDYVR